MKKIVFFDIDGTLFNPREFLDDFFSTVIREFGLKEINRENLFALYEKDKNKNGYFLPGSFLKAFCREFTQIDAKKLHLILWNLDLFEKSMYKDSSDIKNLARKAVLGIFSKGDEKFQNLKLSFLKELFDKENIYIFPNKIAAAKEVFGKYKNYEIYVVDNSLDVLAKLNELIPGINTILIDRYHEDKDNEGIVRVNSLRDINKLI